MIPVMGMQRSGSDADWADLGHSPCPRIPSTEVPIVIAHPCLSLDTTSYLEQRLLSEQHSAPRGVPHTTTASKHCNTEQGKNHQRSPETELGDVLPDALLGGRR